MEQKGKTAYDGDFGANERRKVRDLGVKKQPSERVRIAVNEVQKLGVVRLRLIALLFLTNTRGNGISVLLR